MSPNDNLELFHAILRDFDRHGILGDFILIGSWTLRVYREHFNQSPQIPIVATQDLDFLLPNPPRVSEAVSVSRILENYGLEAAYSPTGDYAKFVGPDLEVEFLYPEKGRGESSGKRVDAFDIVATPLRYMSFIQSHTTSMEYQGLTVRVPEPAVFVLMKYFLTRKRSDREKVAKDLATASELEFFLLENGGGDDLVQTFGDMPKKWRKELLEVLAENDSELVELFSSYAE